MEIRLLATFKAVADKLSFVQAAQDLHYAQSTISAQIASLEEELGVRLFDRLGRRVLLTEAGEKLYPYASRMLDMAKAAKAEVMEEAEVTGTLSVRAPESLVVHRLQPAIAGFRRRMPRVRLNFLTCAQESLMRDLASGVVDLAFLLSESMSAADLEVEALAYEELILVAGKDHPLASAANLSTADLAGHTLLLTRVDCSYRRVLEGLLAALGARAGMVVEFNSMAAAIACAVNGQGVTVLPRVAAKDNLQRGDLVELAWEEKGLEVAVLMLWHRERWLSPAQRCFMDAARQCLGG